MVCSFDITRKPGYCPRCGETENITILPADDGEPADAFDKCNVCGYIYEDCWQSYPWRKEMYANA
jgi:hypothetical protein